MDVGLPVVLDILPRRRRHRIRHMEVHGEEEGFPPGLEPDPVSLLALILAMDLVHHRRIISPLGSVVLRS
jgi:hypothetical protein